MYQYDPKEVTANVHNMFVAMRVEAAAKGQANVPHVVMQLSDEAEALAVASTMYIMRLKLVMDPKEMDSALMNALASPIANALYTWADNLVEEPYDLMEQILEGVGIVNQKRQDDDPAIGVVQGEAVHRLREVGDA